MDLLHHFTEIIAESIREPINHTHRVINEELTIPIDSYWVGDYIRIEADLCGFTAKDIHVVLIGNILWIKAERESLSKTLDKKGIKNYSIIHEHRPIKKQARVWLPLGLECCKDYVLKANSHFNCGLLTVDVHGGKRNRIVVEVNPPKHPTNIKGKGDHIPVKDVEVSGNP